MPTAIPFKNVTFAVVGATGAVGRAILSILSERGVKASNVMALASDRSSHISASFGEHEELPVRSLERFDFGQTQIAFFAASNDVAEIHAPRAAKEGALVIDKSSFFRLNPDVPLVVPEVNAKTIASAVKTRIIANPNCSTIQLLTALAPIHVINPIKRIVIATYQAVSGAGSKAMDILYNETKTVLMNQPSTPNTLFPKPIAFNIIPHIDAFTPDGDTLEELKLRNETHKILDSSVGVSATCVRVPVFVGHSMAVHLELTNAVDVKHIKSALTASKALRVSSKNDQYFTPAEAANEDPVYVSRLRIDPSTPNGLAMWLVTDNIRKGAALNGVQIAETVCKDFPELLRK